MQSTHTARIVLTTAASAEEAGRLARVLVDEQLIACATLLPQAHSIYRWQGEIEETEETVLLLKSRQDLLPDLQQRIRELHSYETPEFLVLAPEAGSAAYLEWLNLSLRLPS